MRRVRRRKMRSTAVILVIVILPVSIIAAVNKSPALNRFAKNATVVSAGMTFWGGSAQNDGATVMTDTAKVQKSAQISEEKTINCEFDESKIISVNSLWSLELAPEEIETPATSEEERQPSGNISDMLEAVPYPSNMETKSGVIKQMTYKKYDGSQFFNLENAGQVRNCTLIKTEDLLAESKKLPDFKIDLNAEPQVLIMHTHTTESYEPYDRDFYDSSFNSRTTDVTKNVVAVGDAIEQELKNAGIGVIHDTTVHDYPNYNGSYDRSRVTVQAILKKYPSIKVVLDVHRDAIQTSDGVRTAPIATVDGKKAAQIMIISGCDDGTMNMPNYMKNFRLASNLQQQLEGDCPGITRPVLFDYRKYNQDLTTGSILLEMGGHGNSIDQAVYSGQLMGKALSETLLKCK